jgi:hypothetical protein
LLREVGRTASGSVDGVVDGSRNVRIAQLASKVDNWSSALHLAREHRMLPLLYRALSDAGAGLPAGDEEKLEIEYRTNVMRCMMNAHELITVLEEFDRESIPMMPFKGVVLAASVYGDFTARNAGDLDLMIHYGDLLRATALLQARGYVLETETSHDGTPAERYWWEYHFERPSDGMVVELRWRLELTQPWLWRDLGMDWVWPGRQTTVIAGVTVPDIQSEIALLMLCMHGCKHLWSRLNWICDVAQLIASRRALDWEQALKLARESGLKRTLAFGVLLAHRVTGVQVPANVLQGFQRDSAASNLARHFDECLFDAPGEAPAGRVPYHFQLLDYKDRVRMLMSPGLLRPSERDRAFIRLPKPLLFLYPLFRPIRILFDRAPRP